MPNQPQEQEEMAWADASEALEETDWAVETEQERVFRWRLQQLADAGYGYRLAFKLALRPQVDLHAAVALVRDGCPASTAARILL
ncbi:MAG: hypothetical protein ACR2OD_10525 [Gaiellaceae bacterium]